MKKWAIATLTASVIFSGMGTLPSFANAEKVDFETAKQKLEGTYNVKLDGHIKNTAISVDDYAGNQSIYDLRTKYVKNPQVKTNLVFKDDGLVYDRRSQGKINVFNGKLDEITPGIFKVKEGRIIRGAAGKTGPFTGEVILDTERPRQLYENDEYYKVKLNVKDGYVKYVSEARYVAFIKGADQLINTSTSMKDPVVFVANRKGVGPDSTKLTIKKGKINTKTKKRIFADKDSGVKYALKKGYVIADAKRFTGKLTLRPLNNSRKTYVKQTLIVKKGLVKALKTKTFDKERYGEALAKLSN